MKYFLFSLHYTIPQKAWGCGENFVIFQNQIKCWATNKLVILYKAGIYIENMEVYNFVFKFSISLLGVVKCEVEINYQKDFWVK